jgi:hypothetical protein
MTTHLSPIQIIECNDNGTFPDIMEEGYEKLHLNDFIIQCFPEPYSNKILIGYYYGEEFHILQTTLTENGDTIRTLNDTLRIFSNQKLGFQYLSKITEVLHTDPSE